MSGYGLDHFLGEYKNSRTEELEEILYRNHSEYSEEALHAVEEILRSRADRRVGITHKYCPNCRRNLDIAQAICECGHNFAVENSDDINAVRRKRIRNHRVMGVVMIVGGAVLFIGGTVVFLSHTTHTESDKYLVGIPLLIVAFGIYKLLTGNPVKGDSITHTVTLLNERDEKDIDSDMPFMVCTGCGKQIFLELGHKKCPQCGQVLKQGRKIGVRS